MNDYRIGYVILHYNTFNETVNCLKDIEKMKKATDIIVVVDNASPDESGQMLFDKYDGRPDIDVLLLPENLGFAKGNNVGINYVREEYNCDFVIVTNSDILIPKTNFGDDADKEAYGLRPDGTYGLLEKDELAPYLEADRKLPTFRDLLLQSYEEHKMAVIGPKIFGVEGNVSKANPTKPLYTTMERIRKGASRNKIRLFLSYLGLDLMPDKLLSTNQALESLDPEKYQENVRLAGCFLIFTPIFFEKMEGFYDQTFLYLEEDILYYQLMQREMVSAYDPALKVIHLEDCATVNVVKGSRKGVKIRRFRYQHQRDSFKAFVDLVEAGQKR